MFFSHIKKKVAHNAHYSISNRKKGYNKGFVLIVFNLVYWLFFCRDISYIVNMCFFFANIFLVFLKIDHCSKYQYQNQVKSFVPSLTENANKRSSATCWPNSEKKNSKQCMVVTTLRQLAVMNSRFPSQNLCSVFSFFFSRHQIKELANY